MIDGIVIRDVREDDSDAILAIYAPYITDTCITFETEVPDPETFAGRVKKISADYPYIVAELSGAVVGYAYASRYNERAAYAYCADMSVYISREMRHHGIGTMLYNALVGRMKARGIHTALACVTYPNEPSMAFHEAFGFSRIGIMHNVGYKMGSWRDVVWYEKKQLDYGEPEKKILKSR